MKKILIISIVVFGLYLISSRLKNKLIRRAFENSNYKYFSYSEFDTPAVQGVDEVSNIYSKNGKSYVKNSGLKEMNGSFLNMLDKARDIIEKEYNSLNPGNRIVFKINSGYRSPQYNKWLDENTSYQVAKTSAHMTGQASDINTAGYTNEQIRVMLNALRRAGFKRFGLASNFIHVDNDSTKTQNISWNYGAGSINIDPFTA
jgi:uncharacterized protein YcbK (DUF882 family)